MWCIDLPISITVTLSFILKVNLAVILSVQQIFKFVLDITPRSCIIKFQD